MSEAVQATTEADLETIRGKCQRLFDQIGQVIVGQDYAVQNLVAALLCQGHCLLIGVPGLAKTLLVKSLAESLDWTFRRIQFTPDLMPGDILGTEVLETDPSTGSRSLRYVPGPIFTHILLADEINRTPPKTQAALLEAMQERAVTVGGRTLPIEPPFFVVATQNPIEQEGTYPLPEAQLDRFMFSIRLDYPDQNDEERIVNSTTGPESKALAPVLSRNDLLSLQAHVRTVPVSSHVISYAVGLARSTRPENPNVPAMVKQYVEWGAGPRASQNLVLGAKARATLMGRPAPSANDVRAVARQVLGHRVLMNYAGIAEGITPDSVIAEVVKHTPEPSYEG